MAERPTPEQIMDRWDYSSNTGLQLELAAHGYVIVHPDDVPEASGWNGGPTIPPGFDMGWNACRDAILDAGVREGTG